MTRQAHFLVAMALISCCCAVGCGGHDTGYRTKGDALCSQLFHDESVYVRSSGATDAGVDRLYGRYLSLAHGLPSPPPSLPGRFLKLDRAMRSAQLPDGWGLLWQLIGAARTERLWGCGQGAVEALKRDSAAVRIGPARPDRATYLSGLQGVTTYYDAKHQEYHAHPDPIERRQRLPDDHGPGFIALQRDVQTKIEQLGTPSSDERTVRTILAFFAETIARESQGVASGGQHGTALFESGFATEGELTGVACDRLSFCS